LRNSGKASRLNRLLRWVVYPETADGGHARPGRDRPRLAASVVRAGACGGMEKFRASGFSAGARKTTPEAGALPFQLRYLGCVED
jgi:hypothetical protein